MRRVLGLALVGMLAACASEPTAPVPTTPLMGSYQVNATFVGVPTNLASVSGTMNFTHVSVTDSTMVATADLKVIVNGDSMTLTAITNVQVSPSGVVSFDVSTPNPTATWTWTGRRSSDVVIAGTHSLASPGVDAAPGSFSMVRIATQ